MKSWSIILATIVIFGAGVFTGGLLVNQIKHPQTVHHSNPQPPSPGSDALPMPSRAIVLNDQLVTQLTDKLSLNPQQSQQIKKIIDQGQQRNHDLWKLVAPQFQLVMRDTRQQIRQVLTSDQRKEFEILMKQQRHPGGTNAPSEQLPSSTNLPPVESPTNPPPSQPAGTTNQPAI